MKRPTYIDKPTKLHKLENISKLTSFDLYIKRDDQSKYLCNGGNKCRKLEYIVADIKKNKCNTIITCGAVQSNHCMLTASAAAKEGLECYIVLEERIPNSYDEKATGNNYLYKLLGAKRLITEKGNTVKVMNELKVKLEKEGKKPYIVPGGGSYSVGTQAYMDCAKEIIDYSLENNIKFDYVFVCSGSGGTHAGLHTGFKLYNYDTKVIGISNNLSKEKQTDKIYNHIQNVIKYLNLKIKVSKEEINVIDDYVGEGYGISTDGMINAIKLFAQKEGILLDTVYTGKCVSGIMDLGKNKDYEGKNAIFINTGGATSLFYYQPL